jgi:hypothetical protein
VTAGLQKRIIKLRAAALLLLFALGLASGPVGAATRDTGVCAMECCVEEGHCCCTPANPYVVGQARPDGDQIGETEISSPCPEGCATPVSSLKLSQRAAVRTQPHAASPSVKAVPRRQYAAIIRESFTAEKSTPRAPPSFLLATSA